MMEGHETQGEGQRVLYAVATSDGASVDQHFGRTSRFDVYEVTGYGHARFVETRAVAPLCQGGHDAHALQETARVLSDCAYVLCARIGVGAETAVERQGAEVYQVEGPVDEAIEYVTSFRQVNELIASYGA